MMQPDLRRTQPRNTRVVWWILAALVAVCVAGGALLAIEPQWLLQSDRDITAGAVERGVETRDFWILIADVFAPWPLRIALLVIAALALIWRHARIALWLISTVALEAIVAPLSKLVLARGRPELPEPLQQIDGYSFPSGHAAAAGMFATALILLTLVVSRRGSWLRRIALLVWVLFTAFIAIDRLVLGAHFLTDVVVGTALGALCAFGPWLLWNHRNTITETIAEHSPHVVAVVYNPVKIGDLSTFQGRIREVAAREGFSEPLWLETTIEDPGTGQAATALQANVDLILTAGGDGTVRMVAEEIARTGTPLGVLPHGTGNLLARNLNLPLNFTESLETAFAGDERAIDLVRLSTDAQTADIRHDADPQISSTSYLVMAGLGMDAAIMTGVRDDLKAKVGYLAYFVSGIKALAFPATRVKISIDDQEPQSFRARTVVVGNVGFLQAGIPLIPEAVIDDGLLDVVVIAPKRFFGWLAIVWRVMTRRKRTNERLERLTGRKVTVTAERPTPMQLDGDGVGEGTRLEAEVEPGVLLVRVPREGTLRRQSVD